ncbi:amidohydrolase family-domain-containing protein [Aspergillus karnatakaensis]|uniref:amidohydrolase family-domain-containing protein n=1 Tax=Aspergillus karnatakaensis TaxID=1810916 RepID=UPI003CCE4BAC
MDTGDRVLCHHCGRVWPRNSHGLDCPHCGSDFTEIIEIPPDTDEPEPSHPDPPESIPGAFPGHRSPSPPAVTSPPVNSPPLNPWTDHNPWAHMNDDDDDLHGWRGPPGYQYTQRTYQSPGGNLRFSFQAHTHTMPNRRAPGARGDTGVDPLVHGLDSFFQSMAESNRERAARAHGPRSPGGRRQPYDDIWGPASPPPHHQPPPGLFPRNADEPQPMQTPLRSLGDLLELFQPEMANPQTGGPRVRIMTSGTPLQALFQALMNIERNGDAVYSQEELDRVISTLVEQNGNRSSAPPAAQDAIRALPKKPATEEMLGSEGTAECSICMDPVKIGDEVTLLPCTHWFHPQCIELWLAQHNTCPHCRRGIDQAATTPEATTSTSTTAPANPSFTSDEQEGSRRRISRSEASGSGSGWASWTLYHNGIITSPTGSPSEATSLVVENGTITYVGSKQDAPSTEKQVDLAGRRVLPGFIDCHMHLLLFGASLSKIDLSNCKTLSDIRSTIRAGAAERPDAPRLFCSGWMHSMTDSKALASMLDDLDPRPIFIDAKDLHSAWCNTAALRDLGVNENTPDPEGGEISRDSEGKPSGLLSEAAAVTIVWPHIAKVATLDEKLGFVRNGVRAYNAAGYTGMIELATDENIWSTVLELRKREEVPVRFAAHWVITPAKEEGDVLKQVDRAIELHQVYNKQSSPDFRIAGIKVICDGVVDACTAALLEPYSTAVASPEPLWKGPLLKKVVQRADDAGLQVALHAIGDKAVKLAIDTLETVKPMNGLTSPGDADRLAELAILRAWPRLLGEERCRRAFAYREFLESGANVAIGTDSPTAPHLPLRNLYTATTRRSAREPEYTATVNPEHAISLAQAVSGATAGSAYSCFADDVTGSLEVGKKADFVVLEMEWEADKLLDAHVVETYFEGKRVFPSEM